MLLAVALALAFREHVLTWQNWLLAGAAGLSAGIGLLLFYRALAMGRMSVAAPVSAVIGAIIPVVTAAFVDGLPGGWTIAGILLALAAVWLISGGGGGGRSASIQRYEFILPAVAGLFFGFYFVCLHQASREAVFWPIVAARSTALIGILAYALVMRQPWQAPRSLWLQVALCGLLDMAGNAFYVLSGQVGRLDVAAVLGSLYPGSTVLLAGLFLHERLGRLQWAGILAALLAIVLMTV
jgi:drug/metabolite transporter (DMT)-like permease